MWYSENIGTFATARPFKYDGSSYPATAFKNPEVLESATIYPLRVEKVDTRYYTQGAMTRTFADGMWTESYEAVPKDFEVLQKELVRYYLNLLDTTLSRTDKFLTRSDEMAQWFSKWNINPALQQWRDGVYLLFNTRMNSITEAVTFEGLKLADEQTFDIPEQPVPYEVETEE
jgi:hypothetical protein